MSTRRVSIIAPPIETRPFPLIGLYEPVQARFGGNVLGHAAVLDEADRFYQLVTRLSSMPLIGQRQTSELISLGSNNSGFLIMPGALHPIEEFALHAKSAVLQSTPDSLFALIKRSKGFLLEANLQSGLWSQVLTDPTVDLEPDFRNFLTELGDDIKRALQETDELFKTIMNSRVGDMGPARELNENKGIFKNVASVMRRCEALRLLSEQSELAAHSNQGVLDLMGRTKLAFRSLFTNLHQNGALVRGMPFLIGGLLLAGLTNVS